MTPPPHPSRNTYQRQRGAQQNDRTLDDGEGARICGMSCERRSQEPGCPGRSASAFIAISSLAIDEAVILMTPLFIHIETPDKGTGDVQQNDSLVRRYSSP